jgi:hypothetical protein
MRDYDVPGVIFLSYLPLTKKLENDLYIPDLRAKGVNPVYWDVSHIFFPSMRLADQIEVDYVRVFQSLGELEQEISRTEYATVPFLVYITQDWSTRKLFRILTRHRRLIDYFALVCLPLAQCSTSKRGWKTILKNIITEKGFMNERLRSLAIRVMKRIGYLKPFDRVFCAGEAGRAAHADAREFVPFHFFDYDVVLQLGVQEPSKEGPYAVFLDNYYPHHPDFKANGRPSLDPDQYYTALNRWFGEVEREWGISVVIAAHPKAEYNPEQFRGRRIVKYNTASLVQDSELVVAHYSSAISFAVIYSKPILFLTSDQINSLYKYRDACYIRTLAEYLVAPLLNMDRPESFMETQQELIVNIERYNAYKYDHLVSRSQEGRTSAQILIDAYQKNNDE